MTEFKVSNRANRLRITIHPDGRCVVTVPRIFSKRLLERFLRERAGWIKEKQDHFLKHPPVIRKTGTRADFLKNKEAARKLVHERIVELNKSYGFTYGRIAIRNQKSRWGSCSKKGNLNFNYRIVHLTPEQQDYIIVHELCHLKEFNHGPKFWGLVQKTIPGFAALRRSLKK
jgi:predicted metal-dependent hydrolase